MFQSRRVPVWATWAATVPARQARRPQRGDPHRWARDLPGIHPGRAASMTRRASMRGLLLVLTVLASRQDGTAQVGDAVPSPVPDSLVGSVSFDLHCASCHGRSGKGDGPVAIALRAPPADLTVLARRNAGTFPRARTLAFVDGSNRIVAHSGLEMPVWGPTLRRLDGSDARDTVRLRNLIAFIESIQEPASGIEVLVPDVDGGSLYRDRCASCHGKVGQGDGPMVRVLQRTPPNLSTLGIRNGGAFPGERIRRAMAGVGVAAHGDRAMPIWGDLFARSGPADAGAEARIDALVQFLESIQQKRQP